MAQCRPQGPAPNRSGTHIHEMTNLDSDMINASKKYVVISPCRDEAKFMRETLDSVVGQSIKPAKWIIVDDGSTDDTPKILQEYRQKHNWIEVVTRTDRGGRAVGPGVIDAFYAGYDTINPDEYE